MLYLYFRQQLSLLLYTDQLLIDKCVKSFYIVPITFQSLAVFIDCHLFAFLSFVGLTEPKMSYRVERIHIAINGITQIFDTFIVILGFIHRLACQNFTTKLCIYLVVPFEKIANPRVFRHLKVAISKKEDILHKACGLWEHCAKFIREKRR